MGTAGLKTLKRKRTLYQYTVIAVTDKLVGTLHWLSEDFRQKEYQPERPYSTTVASLSKLISYAQTLKVPFGSCVIHRDGAPPGMFSVAMIRCDG